MATIEIRSKAIYMAILTLLTICIAVPALSLAKSPKPITEDCLLCTFDINQPTQVVKLPAKFREASGLAITSSGLAIVHGDEKASLLYFDPMDGRIAGKLKIKKDEKTLRGDFEGIAQSAEDCFLITAGGTLVIYQCDLKGNLKDFDTVNLGLKEKFEFEGLEFRASTNSLLLAVKTIYDKSDSRGLLLLEWSIADQKLMETEISIDKETLLSKLGLAAFHTSGVVFDEASGHYLLVSSADRMLLELSPLGELVASVKLKKKSHRQPEGLAILNKDGEQVLLIADEGKKKHAIVSVYGRAK
jgi:uncharacterized protein YjiK